jgi:hypothetical protein
LQKIAPIRRKQLHKSKRLPPTRFRIALPGVAGETEVVQKPSSSGTVYRLSARCNVVKI